MSDQEYTAGKINRWRKRTKSKPASKLVPMKRCLGSGVMATKEGGYLVTFAAKGIDSENITRNRLNAISDRLASVLNTLPHGVVVYQYCLKHRGYDLPSTPSGRPISDKLSAERIAYLNQNARFSANAIFWSFYAKPPKIKNPADKQKTSAKLIKQLLRSVLLVQAQLADVLELKQLDHNESAGFWSYLLNLEKHLTITSLRSSQDVDEQLAGSSITWEKGNDFLKVGHRYVQPFSVKNNPKGTRPNLLGQLMSLDCDLFLCSIWQGRSTSETKAEISRQEGFIGMFKHRVAKLVSHSGTNREMDASASSIAADAKTRDLASVLLDAERDGHRYGHFSLYGFVHSHDAEHVRDIMPQIHRIFRDPADLSLIEETRGAMSAYYAIFPGNGDFVLRKRWLRDDHNANLALAYAPNIGKTYSDDLDAEYLCIYETRDGSPFFYDPYVSGLRGTLIVGAPRRGKSVNGNFHVLSEAKYGGFTTIYDIGGSYESTVLYLGGAMIRVGADGPRMNPFAAEPTKRHIRAVFVLVKQLLSKSGAKLSPEEEDGVVRKIEDVYCMPRSVRRLRSLVLPIRLQSYLSKWVGDGLYSHLFDNVDDQLELSRIQAFDFQDVTKDDSEMLAPVIYWLSYVKGQQWHDPANLHLPKHDVYDELWKHLDIDLWDEILNSLKTGGKHLGGVTLLTHLVDDLGQHAKLIKNACPTLMFLGDDAFDRDFYAKFFSLNERELDNMASLKPRELFLHTPEVSKVLKLNLDAKTYNLFTTKPKDRVRRAKLIEQHGFDGAVEALAATAN